MRRLAQGHLDTQPGGAGAQTSNLPVTSQATLLTSTSSQPNTLFLTDAICVCHAFPRHTVSPEALVHIVVGVTVLHPVVGCRGDHEEYVPHAGTEQPSTHEAVHPANKRANDRRT